MPRKSYEEIARRDVRRLIDYACKNLELDGYDAVYVENSLLNFFALPEPFLDDIGTYDLYSTLDSLFSFAVKKKIYEEHERLLFEGRVMGALMPMPSTVVERFDAIASYTSSADAAKWLQKLEENSTYLRRPDLDKNVKWVHNAERGDIVVTINLAKPEKTPEEVERAKNAKTGYPKCVLCAENLGYYGNAGQPARQHIRTIPIELDGEDWFMQFSPYEYFEEHVIAISEEHRPMKLDESAFRRMLDFVDLFPEYFIGSNAPLPIVGGSVLAHDHYQGGRKVLPVFGRPARKHYLMAGHPEVTVSIVDWYNSVVRIEGKHRESVVKAAEAFRSAWDNYSDESVNVIAKTDAQHNTVTPIAYLNDEGEYAIILILRNNRTDEKHPYGIFHPTEDMHNIKKESIGIIEAMGLFILPGRLQAECENMRGYFTGATPLNFAELAKDTHPLHKHFGMIAQIASSCGTSLSDAKAEEAITDYINTTCEKILDCTAVFKSDEQGKNAFDMFVKSVVE